MAAMVPCSGVAGGQAHVAHAGAPTSGFFADVSLGHSGREPTDERSRTKVCATKHMDPPPPCGGVSSAEVPSTNGGERRLKLHRLHLPRPSH